MTPELDPHTISWLWWMSWKVGIVVYYFLGYIFASVGRAFHPKDWDGWTSLSYIIFWPIVLIGNLFDLINSGFSPVVWLSEYIRKRWIEKCQTK